MKSRKVTTVKSAATVKRPAGEQGIGPALYAQIQAVVRELKPAPQR